MTLPDPLLRVQGLRTYFYTYAGIVKAVDNVSLEVNKGETLGVVGESGSGKTVTAQSVLRVVPPPGKIVDGKIEFQGKNLLALRETEMQQIRGKEIAYIFQDPTTTLDPVYTVGDQLAEVIMRHQKLSKKDAWAKAADLLKMVDIPDADIRIHQYPHELSGGTKQRIAIARALSCEPILIIADEPTTALDVTIQAQILDLLREIKNRMKIWNCRTSVRETEASLHSSPTDLGSKPCPKKGKTVGDSRKCSQPNRATTRM